jgi:ABC-2 type transport system ATP-binding protein
VKETYRSNTYVVNHRGTFTLEGNQYDLLEQRVLEDEWLKSVIKVHNGISPNQLIRNLTDITEVHSFIEKIPTMSEIFINLVKGGTHE